MTPSPRPPARAWFDRLLCALGIHDGNVQPIGLHRSKCYDCGREWSE